MIQDVEILKKKETPLLSRERVSVMVHYEGSTPSRLELRDVIAKKIAADPELTVVRHIYQRYGSPKAKVISHVYSNKESLAALEEDYLLKKHTKEQPKEEAAQE